MVLAKVILLVLSLLSSMAAGSIDCERDLELPFLRRLGSKERRLTLRELERYDQLARSNPSQVSPTQATINGDFLEFPNGTRLPIVARRKNWLGQLSFVTVSVPYGEIFTDQAPRYTSPMDAKKMAETNPKGLKKWQYGAGAPGKRDYVIQPDGRFLRLDGNHRSLAVAFLHVMESHRFPAGKTFQDFYQVFRLHSQKHEDLYDSAPRFAEAWVAEAYETMMRAEVRFEVKVDQANYALSTTDYMGSIVFNAAQALFAR